MRQNDLENHYCLRTHQWVTEHYFTRCTYCETTTTQHFYCLTTIAANEINIPGAQSRETYHHRIGLQDQRERKLARILVQDK